jgi:predicted transcriptional regulator
MAMAKVTYTLDDRTVDLLKRTAAQQRKPQSQVVREAIAEYAARVERLS